MRSLSPNQRGIACMVGAMALYVLNDALVKLTTRQFGPGQILAVRGFFATMMVAGIAHGAGQLRNWRLLRQPMVGARSGLEVTTAASSVAALALAPLATVTAIMMVAPLLIVMSAVLMGWEQARAHRIAPVLLGFVGVLLVIRPTASFGDFNWGLAFALACAASLAARDIVTRAISPEVPTVLIALVTTAAVCVAGVALGSGETWQPLDRFETALLALAAICAALGNYALIEACRGVDLSVVTPFRYTVILWALLLGYLGWGETPDARSTIGIVLISAAGLYSLLTNQRR